MKKITLLFICFICFANVKAQYVTIPDAKFAAYLQSIIPSAMNGNQMDTTSTAVTTLTRIYVENDSIGDLTGVQYFDSLKTLDCGNGQYSLAPPNFLTSLPKLPTTLDTLVCGNNQIASLPILPNTLTVLKCYSNQLNSLPALPNSLQYLDCNSNQLNNLSVLPNNLQYLFCSSNYLTNLPVLSNSLKVLVCNNNQIASLPILPNSMRNLLCYNNQLTALPVLPNALIELLCYGNQLTSLPSLPTSLFQFDCSSNQIFNLPTLPNSLNYLDCSHNQISCFPVFPNSLTILCNISNNPFTCLPNYVTAMDVPTLAYPLCMSGNSNNCPSSQGVFGYTYKDMNGNCMKNAGDTNLKNIPVQLYDTANNLLGQTYSALNGVYDFPQTMGTYTVVVDTLGSVPYMAQCNNLGLDSTVTVANIDTNINFSLTCKPGFDVGVLSTIASGLAFPGQPFVLNTIAGDISQWYNLNCAAGVSGQVQITITGPVTYVGAASGALNPAVGGNVYTYNIADFGAVNIMTAFNMAFYIDSSAQAGNLVCINIAVTPTVGDNNVSNNNYSFCFAVQNSHDPNLKETYPVNVLPGYNDWFTYTIHFQNTGTAQALNIRLVDTLDANLDLKTFQVINYSHANTASVNGNALAFNFPNINLPDSISNPLGSIGFVQYKVKPKANLPNGTQIKNTAYIYFDFNAPIVTDTTINLFTTSAGISQISGLNTQISIYPNPSNGSINVSSTNNIDEMKVTDLIGQLVYEAKPNSTTTKLNLTNGGIYFITITSGTQVSTQKVIVNK